MRTALVYAHNHCDALQRFFDDGRLVLTKNWAERAFKPVATGRKAWLLCGSDDHAKSTAALFSRVGSARLHALDPEEYLRCLIRLVPLWPAERMIEFCPLCWNLTRTRLDPQALAAEFGRLCPAARQGPRARAEDLCHCVAFPSPAQHAVRPLPSLHGSVKRIPLSLRGLARLSLHGGEAVAGGHSGHHGAGGA